MTALQQTIVVLVAFVLAIAAVTIASVLSLPEAAMAIVRATSVALVTLFIRSPAEAVADLAARQK